MGKFYIYNSNIDNRDYKNATVIFNPNITFDFNALQNELSDYFSNHHQTSAIIFLHCSTINKVDLLIAANFNKIFKSIPKAEEISLSENIFHVSYYKDSYQFSSKDKFIKRHFKEIINQGLANIFIKNGGLVESNGISHHYVFPSGKHSSKFLRTANVLTNKSEIDFIALNTLHQFKGIDFNNIYCDTLSINVIAYSITHYLDRFGNSKSINIESFKSYNGIYNENSIFYEDSIFLISASTSGGIIYYLKDKHPEIDSKNICILYYLPIDKNSHLALESVICNLLLHDKLKYGIEIYAQFKVNQKCVFCENNSSPIKIIGDSFSLDEPIINTRNIIAKKYITKPIKDFVETFKFNNKTGTSLKVSYSEESTIRKKYNLYIDYENIIENISEEQYKTHREKIDAYVDQFVPASLKYIIYLNDKGSLLLSEYIHERIKKYSNNSIQIINQSDLNENSITKDTPGSVLIVGSCITNGKNLLYLSRFFRNHDNIRLIYFIGINRISDSTKQRELKSNIKYGLYGAENSSFIEIENIFCDNLNISTPWENELEHLKDIQSSLDKSSTFIEKRIIIINEFSNIKNKGGTTEIFYGDINENELKIRKNSAFFNDNNYFENVTQSDVYFTISCVLTNMRNNKIDGLFQTNFVKNLLDPLIFNRFNDGIIQASILRASKNEELNYSISYKSSENMLTLLKTFIKHRNEYQGEAIIEFLYALSIGKLRLFKDHYRILIEELNDTNDKKINIFNTSINTIYKNSL
ncbi:hypothetical protein CXF68_14845 [Tenacibaculum sp. Bg11-29]|uniref:hypothetical protein n=1 Tax=Tenacibaculum sp. Bg11-29 TaxID=2058306 RepID=UPI000C322E0A|nr:hypothetical protein [Tenacibaculum sp. Bg11-29]PKH51884.1 hypothetical protein CXF68_14845 [Tenacibaculum sp. Bg11-29]